MTDLEALALKVAELELRLAAATPPPPEPLMPVAVRTPYVYVPPATVGLATLAATHPEFRYLNIRQVRQLAAAVALCKGAPLPGSEVPSDFEPVMKRLAAARSKSMSWRAALGECNLEAPDDDEIAHQARMLRDSLTGLWDLITSVMSTLESRLPNWVFFNLLKKLRSFL